MQRSDVSLLQEVQSAAVSSSVNGVQEWVPHSVSMRVRWENPLQVLRVLSGIEEALSKG